MAVASDANSLKPGESTVSSESKKSNLLGPASSAVTTGYETDVEELEDEEEGESLPVFELVVVDEYIDRKAFHPRPPPFDPRPVRSLGVKGPDYFRSLPLTFEYVLERADVNDSLEKVPYSAAMREIAKLLNIKDFAFNMYSFWIIDNVTEMLIECQKRQIRPVNLTPAVNWFIFFIRQIQITTLTRREFFAKIHPLWLKVEEMMTSKGTQEIPGPAEVVLSMGPLSFFSYFLPRESTAPKIMGPNKPLETGFKSLKGSKGGLEKKSSARKQSQAIEEEAEEKVEFDVKELTTLCEILYDIFADKVAYELIREVFWKEPIIEEITLSYKLMYPKLPYPEPPDKAMVLTKRTRHSKSGSAGGKSPKRGSMKRGSVKRGSMKRGSVKRGSMKRGSVKRKSMKRGSVKRQSMKRKSMKRGSIKQKKSIKIQDISIKAKPTPEKPEPDEPKKPEDAKETMVKPSRKVIAEYDSPLCLLDVIRTPSARDLPQEAQENLLKEEEEKRKTREFLLPLADAINSEYFRKIFPDVKDIDNFTFVKRPNLQALRELTEALADSKKPGEGTKGAPKRGSMKNAPEKKQSIKRGSMKRGSMKRGSMKRKSMKRGSMKSKK